MILNKIESCPVILNVNAFKITLKQHYLMIKQFVNVFKIKLFLECDANNGKNYLNCNYIDLFDGSWTYGE